MGGSESTTNIKNENNTLVVNKSKLNSMSENVNQNATNVTMDAAKDCASNTDLMNEISFRGADIGGDFNISGADLSQKAEVSFTCIQNSDFNNTLSNSIMQSVVNSFQNINDTDIKDKIATAAENASSSGFGATSGSASNTNIDNINNFESLNETEKNIHNITKNIIENNVKMSDAQKCFIDVRAKQGIDATGAKISGSVNISDFKSEQVVSNFGECMQESTMTNTVLNDVASALGIEVKDENTTAKKLDQTTDSKNTSATQGVGGAIGEMAEGIGKGISTALEGAGSLLGNLPGLGLLGGLGGMGGMGSSSSPSSSSLILCCCCLLVLMFAGGGLGGMGGDDKENDDYDDDDYYDDKQWGGSTSSFSNFTNNVSATSYK